MYKTKKLFRQACVQRAVSRKRGCMPADSFVRIWKFIARPNLCETPACVKPPPRYVQAADNAAGQRNEMEQEKQTEKLKQ